MLQLSIQGVKIMEKIYDVIIVGSGVVGSAVARELSRYKLNIAVLEKELDVCSETSGRNSGVLHAGFNNRTGSLMAKYCVEGCLGFDRVAKELDIPFKRTGKIVVGFNEEDLAKLKSLKEQGDKNGVPGLEIVGKDQIKSLAPYIGGEFALYSPMTGILNPFIYTIALAENAHKNGAEFFLDHEVTSIHRSENLYWVKTKKQQFKTRWIINCAGLNSDKVARMLGIDDYTIYPCRGEYFILDQKAGQFLEMPAYPVPNIKEGGLGIHITPSVDGNILVGPSTEYIDKKDNYASTQKIMDLLIRDGGKIFPYLKREYFIRNFTGIRPKLVGEHEGGYADFVIDKRVEIPNSIHLVGIESPGLTSAIPLAKRVVELIAQDQSLIENKNFDPYHKGILSFKEQPTETKRALIEKNSNYGEIICRCETITKAEILEAIHNPLGVETVVGIKNRTRAMMGRCQGGYCQTRISELIMEEKLKSESDILYSRSGSNMFVGKVRSI
jgi:glycerol-3-phosphate dehydrogenase